MELGIEIETHDRSLSFDLLEAEQLSCMETTKDLGNGVTIKYNFEVLRKAGDLPIILNIAAFLGQNIALPVAVGILSSYLYDKLKNRKVEQLKIAGNSIEINKQDIEQLLLLILKEKE